MAKKSGKTKTASGAAPAPGSKTKAASQSFNDDIAQLLEIASGVPLLTFPERKSAAKLYELAILAEVLWEYRVATSGVVRLVQPNGGVPNTFAGAPASTNKNKFAWFELINATGQVEAEVWVPLEFVGLSASLAMQQTGPGGIFNVQASSHELDISVIAPEVPGAPPRPYPQHYEVLAAISVKHVSCLAKESIREALGFRRELGFLDANRQQSSCGWLQPDVPCRPPSPLFLVSSAENFESYDGHIDQLGLYARFMKFPY